MENIEPSKEHGIHFEKTYFGDELMTADFETDSSLSNISLMFLLDTGWY
jgi:hypothetical protein